VLADEPDVGGLVDAVDVGGFANAPKVGNNAPATTTTAAPTAKEIPVRLFTLPRYLSIGEPRLTIGLRNGV